MKFEFTELDYQKTPLGDISLRRRAEPQLDGKILYEVKLDDEFLMSSLFTEAEVELARLGLGMLEGTDLDIVVGGLGLGYTALAVLENTAVRSLRVIEIMQPVINWHRQGMVPLGEALVSDARCTFVHGDFFALASSGEGFDQGIPGKLVHGVLLDIDHSPVHWLNSGNESFYTVRGLQYLAACLHTDGIFGLWSNDPPDAKFVDMLGNVFIDVESRVIKFANPYSGGESCNTVYLARKH